MIKICIAQDIESPDSVKFYRTSGPVSYLERIFPQFRVDYKPKQYFLGASDMNAFTYDVVLVERPITQDAYHIVTRCKNMGTVVWVDYDDNLFQIPDYNNAQDYFGNQQTMQLVQAIMQMADLVTVSTPHLKKLYGGMNKNVHLIRNAWCDYRFPMPGYEDAGKPVKMAWRGGNKHDMDVYEVREPLALSIQDPAFQWTFYGVRPFYLGIPRQNYKPFSGLFTYLQSFILSTPDFLFVPLQANDFNVSKSNCSWIEACLAGAVTIAPMSLPEFDQPGVIRYKDNTHLKKIFDGIKKGKYDKRERVEASRKALFENFRLSELNKLRKEALEQVLFPVKNEVEHASTEG